MNRKRFGSLTERKKERIKEWKEARKSNRKKERKKEWEKARKSNRKKERKRELMGRGSEV